MPGQSGYPLQRALHEMHHSSCTQTMPRRGAAVDDSQVSGRLAANPPFETERSSDNLTRISNSIMAHHIQINTTTTVCRVVRYRWKIGRFSLVNLVKPIDSRSSIYICHGNMHEMKPLAITMGLNELKGIAIASHSYFYNIPKRWCRKQQRGGVLFLGSASRSSRFHHNWAVHL